MLITVSKRDLQDALKVVSHTVASGGSDISAHYVFRQSGAGLEVLSFNGRIFSSCPVNAARIEEEGKAFTIEAKRMNLLLDAVEDDVALRFAATGSETVVTSRGKNVFAGLDPDLFPYWDELLKSAELTATLPAKRLSGALSHAKAFTYDQEAKASHLCVAEFRNGCLYSTDQMAVSIVKVEGMEKSALRIFNKDIGAVISFLSSFKDSGKADDPSAIVELYEHDRAMFLKRNDGAVFGESKYGSRFPDLSVDWTLEDDHIVEVRKTEVASAVKFLASGARWEDNAIKVEVLEAAIKFSMSSANGKPISLEVPAKVTQNGAAVDLPEGGFPVRNDYILSLLNHFSQDVIQLGFSKKGKGGWVRVKDTRGEDTYLTTVSWLKIA